MIVLVTLAVTAAAFLLICIARLAGQLDQEDEDRHGIELARRS